MAKSNPGFSYCLSFFASNEHDSGGGWIASVGIYQRLALNLTQQEIKRSQLRKELDAFEAQEQVRSNLTLSAKGISNDIARVPNGNRSMRTTTQSIIKDKR
ncbi:hypothetical protein [Polynucleobacter necessarius]|uniref:hypothetical protein n=1 Tax=Polynucleobacter necessarius TaxID=576610 RepID=UPI0013B04E80|nr:hypothetical protein [Polynucleobacter necessarius]